MQIHINMYPVFLLYIVELCLFVLIKKQNKRKNIIKTITIVLLLFGCQ